MHSNTNTDSLNINQGFILGLTAVVAFSFTLPLTRYLTQYISVWEIGLGRSALAACVAAIILIVTRQKIPSRRNLGRLALTSTGISFGFPILTAVGMSSVPASHGAILLGALPLATALIGCGLSGERPSKLFWFVASLGFLTVAAYAFISTGGATDLRLYSGDLALAGAVLLAGLGYAQGGLVAKEIGGWQVICWTLVVSIPVLFPLTLWLSEPQSLLTMGLDGWVAFLVLSLFNSLIGFFFWYKALAIGGVSKISQIQLLQPFFTMLFAVLFFGEAFEAHSIVFLTATVLIVIISKRIPVT